MSEMFSEELNAIIAESKKENKFVTLSCEFPLSKLHTAIDLLNGVDFSVCVKNGICTVEIVGTNEDAHAEEEIFEDEQNENEYAKTHHIYVDRGQDIQDHERYEDESEEDAVERRKKMVEE